MTAEAIDHTARTIASPEPPATAYVPIQLCRCGHELEAHEHHRAGDDCGACGAARCRRFRRRTGRAARSPFRRIRAR